MIQVTVKDKQGESRWQALFETQELADAWIAEQIALNSWGLPERWLPLAAGEEVPADALDTRTVVDVPAQDGQPEQSHVEYKMPAEYTVEQSTVDDSEEQKKQQYAREKHACDQVVMKIRYLNELKGLTQEQDLAFSQNAEIKNLFFYLSAGSAQACYFLISMLTIDEPMITQADKEACMEILAPLMPA